MVAASVIPDTSRLASLTDRERVFLRLVAECLSDDEIAARMKREPTTVRTHLRRIKKKLGTGRRSVLVRFAVRAGLVEV